MLPAGAYTVESLIGHGGMGAVYKGTQLRLKRPVAIKIMRQDVEADADFSARFLREAHTLARLSHPGIVNVIDCGRDGADLSYIIMEFVDGTDLAELLRSGPLTEARVLELLPQICDALQFAHDNGIIHRDIKPSNILIGRNGRVKLVDFGLARPVEPGSTLQSGSHVSSGTPFYAAPEQLTPGAALDHRADIFALGVLLYQMPPGRLPRGAWQLPSQIAAVSRKWDAIVERAMQQRTEDRHASASQLRADALAISTASAAASEASASSRKSFRLPLMAGAALVALVIAGWSTQDLWKPGAAAEKTSSAVPAPTAPAGLPPVELPTPSPAAIRIWDTRETIAKRFGTVEDGVLHLSDLVGAHHLLPAPIRDVAFRTKLRMNPDMQEASVAVRLIPSGQPDQESRGYFLGASNNGISLQYRQHGANKVFGQWPLPRAFGPDEFMALELRVQGNRLTALAEGKVLGTVETNDLPEPGGLQVFAKANSHWRDSEYIPLGPAPTSPAGLPPVELPTPLPAAVRLWDTPEKARAIDAIWENEALRLEAKAVKHMTTLLRDVLFRAKVRMNPDALHPNINIRVHRQPEVGQDASYTVVIADGEVQLQVLPPGLGQKRISLIKWLLPRAYGPEEWAALEVRAIGDRFTVLMDGQVLGTVEDSRLSTPGGLMVFSKANGHFRDIEYVPLGPEQQAPGTAKPMRIILKEPPPPQPAPAPAAWVDVTSAVQTAVVNAGAGTIRDGRLQFTQKHYMALPDGLIHEDVAVRMKLRGSGVISLRYIPEYRSYQSGVDQHGVGLWCWDGGLSKRVLFHQTCPLPPDFVPAQDYELLMAVRGDLIQTWVNGRLVASHQDSDLKQGRIGLSFTAADVGSPLMPNLQKVEYAVLKQP